MQVETSKSLIFFNYSDQLYGYNLLNGELFETEALLFDFLNKFKDGQNIEGKDLEDCQPAIDAGILLENNSELYNRQEEFDREWKLGLPAAMFHFSLLDREYVDLDYNDKFQAEKSQHTPSPPLYVTNQDLETVELNALKSGPVVDTMKKRRTERDYVEGVTTLDTVSDMFFCGLGVTDKTENSVGDLPLKMTPSGGARNPFEAYLIAKNVDGLTPGVYHYSATEHNLGFVSSLPNEQLSSLVANQDWIDDKNALIVLVAYMERSMWKYEDPNIYRAIMIEAGHIAQNMMLIATRDNHTLCPSAAISHSKMMQALKVEQKLTRTPVYALALGPLPKS